jgi:plastocyanin
VIVPDALLGSNKRTHDAYIPAVLTASAGQQVIVTVYNQDSSPHSFTVPALGLNVIVPGAKAQGLEGTITFSFTASKPGTYHWKCILPCDNGGANAWAMTHDGYMAGTITIAQA